jgi:hypothetical protein
MPDPSISSCHVPPLIDVAPVRAAFATLCADIGRYGWAVAYELPDGVHRPAALRAARPDRARA